MGHAELLDTADAVAHWKASGLDLRPVLHVPQTRGERHRVREQDHGLDRALDNTLILLAEGALEQGTPVRLELPVRNVNRTVGTMLGSEVTRRWGGAGLPDGTIDITLTGSAGQSLGAFLPRGVTLRLRGDANDYLGKGLSGGRIIAAPQATSPTHLPGPLHCGSARHRGQRHRLRRDQRGDLPARRGRGAVLRPQLRGHGGGRRAPGTTAAST